MFNFHYIFIVPTVVVAGYRDVGELNIYDLFDYIKIEQTACFFNFLLDFWIFSMHEKYYTYLPVCFLIFVDKSCSAASNFFAKYVRLKY